MIALHFKIIEFYHDKIYLDDYISDINYFNVHKITIIKNTELSCAF